MDNCKDCRFWLQTGHRLGRCSKVTVTDDHWAVVRTHEEERKAITDGIFGCIHFEEKTKRPFYMTGVVNGELQSFAVHYKLSGCGPTMFNNKDVAEMWADWLNGLWSKRETITHTCRTCRFWSKRYHGGACAPLSHFNGHQVVTKSGDGCAKWMSKDEQT